jgi:hypothetical protein
MSMKKLFVLDTLVLLEKVKMFSSLDFGSYGNLTSSHPSFHSTNHYQELDCVLDPGSTQIRNTNPALKGFRAQGYGSSFSTLPLLRSFFFSEVASSPHSQRKSLCFTTQFILQVLQEAFPDP